MNFVAVWVVLFYFILLCFVLSGSCVCAVAVFVFD